MCVCVWPSENNLIAQGLCFFAPPQELIELLQQEPLHNQNKERNVIVHLELGVFFETPHITICGSKKRVKDQQF